MGKIQLYIGAFIVSLCFLTGCNGDKEVTNLSQGMEAVEAYDYETALTFFDAATVKKESKQLIARGRGLAYLGLAMYDDAIASLEESLQYSDVRISEIDYDINYYLAVAYVKSGRLDDALERYNAIIQMKPKEEDAYYLRGIVLLQQGNKEGAIADFEKAIALSNQDFDLIIDVFSTLSEQGETESANTFLEKSLETDIKRMSEYEKGRMYYYLEDYEQARVSLEKVKDSEGSKAVSYLGKTYEKLGDYNYAISVYNNYLMVNEEDAFIYNQLGLCQLETGAYESALSAFQSALAIGDSEIVQSLKYNEIITYEYLGDFAKASVLMKSYLELYPHDTKAQREYEFLQTR